MFLMQFLKILFIIQCLQINSKEIINAPLVTINNEQILISDINEIENFYKYSKIPNFNKVEALNNLINNKIIKAYYKDIFKTKEIKAQLEIQTKLIEKGVESYCYNILKEYFNNNEDDFFKQFGASINDYIENIVKIQNDQMLISLIMQKLAIDKYVSPKTITEFFKKKTTTNEKFNKYEVSELVIYKSESNELENLVKNIYKEIINKKSDFEKIIDKYSDEDINFGFVDVLKNRHPFDYCLLKLNKNEISNIIKSDDAYYVVKWTEKNNNLYKVVGLTLYKKTYDNDDKILEFIKKIKDEIKNNKINWEDAVIKYSENKNNKNYYGVILNSKNSWLLTKNDLSKDDYDIISKLKESEISDPIPLKENNKNGYKILYLKKIHKYPDNNIEYDTLVDEYNNLMQDKIVNGIAKNILKSGKINIWIDLGYDICRKWFINKSEQLF